VKKKSCLELKFYKAIGVKEFKDTLVDFERYFAVKNETEDLQTMYHFPKGRLKTTDLKSQLYMVNLNLAIKIPGFGIPAALAFRMFANELSRCEPLTSILTMTAAVGLGLTYTILVQRYNQLRLREAVRNMEAREKGLPEL